MATTPSKKISRAAHRQKRSTSRKRIVEWAVILPVLVGSLLTAGPQWIDSIRAASQGIQSGSLKDAREQTRLWQKNLACAAAPFAWFNSPSNVKVDATLCDSGDIFVRAITPDNKQYFRWQPLSDVLQSKDDGGGLIGEANATNLLTRASPVGASLADRVTQLAQAEAKVVCQKFIDDRHLLRRVQTPRGCFDEMIDTFNGTVVSRKPAPCNPQC